MGKFVVPSYLQREEQELLLGNIARFEKLYSRFEDESPSSYFQSQLSHVFGKANSGVALGILALVASQYDLASGGRERIHGLLYGEPGCGKTVGIEFLEANFDALYLSCDPSSATLKGSGSLSDGGVQLLHKYDNGIVGIDDFELMKDTDSLRDVMESGRYTLSKAGKHEEYTARCRIIGAANDISSISPAMLSRFDLIFEYNLLTPKELQDSAVSFLHSSRAPYELDPIIVPLLRNISPFWLPEVSEDASEAMVYQLDNYCHEYGPRSYRWLASVGRIARSLARVDLSDIQPIHVDTAYRFKEQADRVIDLHS